MGQMSGNGRGAHRNCLGFSRIARWPVTNRDLSRWLGRVRRRWRWLRCIRWWRWECVRGGYCRRSCCCGCYRHGEGAGCRWSNCHRRCHCGRTGRAGAQGVAMIQVGRYGRCANADCMGIGRVAWGNMTNCYFSCQHCRRRQGHCRRNGRRRGNGCSCGQRGG
jgi:hypothetical protein